MADARRVAQQMARRYFKKPRDQAIFMRQMGDEAGFRDVTSPAGAQGPAQIMPATAKAWGVTNVHDPGQAYSAAASHMVQYLKDFGGDWRKALTAYNAGPGAVNRPLPAETRNYISTILGGGDATAGATSSAAATLPTESVQLAQRRTFDQAGFDQARREFVLGSMIARHEPNSILLKSGVLSTSAPNPADFESSRLTSKTITSGGGGSPSGGGGSVAAGKVAVAAGADRAGVGLQPVLKDYVAAVAGRARRPITITTGTNHNQMTVDGNVSDHWDGHAADIGVPIDSRQGDAIAAHALQEAGVPWSQAISMAQRGGLYSLDPSSGPFKGRRVQVIWKTNQGGNHHNHVHIGVR